MATHAPRFTLKIAKVWPPARDIRVNQLKKIFGMIDYVIHLYNLAKFGLGKSFGDSGTELHNYT